MDILLLKKESNHERQDLRHANLPRRADFQRIGAWIMIDAK